MPSSSQQNRWSTFLLLCGMAIACAPGLFAQGNRDTDKPSKDAPAKAASAVVVSPAPVPPQILTGRKVFIANDRTEPLFDSISYNGGMDRPYSEFYSMLKATGRYQAEPTPSEAELVFEIHLILLYRNTDKRVDELELTIRDPKSNVMLWRLHQDIESAFLLSNRDKNFDQAMQLLVSQVLQLALTPTVAPVTAPKVDDNGE